VCFIAAQEITGARTRRKSFVTRRKMIGMHSGRNDDLFMRSMCRPSAEDQADGDVCGDFLMRMEVRKL
jgi:hypothetical protein